MSKQQGKQSLQFEDPPYVVSCGSIVGKKEGEGPLGEKFDRVIEDETLGCDNWEQAESSLQKEALLIALGKAGVSARQLRYLFAGDLLGQAVATCFGLQQFEVPLFGLYGACSTAGESLSLGAMAVAAGYADAVAAVTSSHFASAEKQFRFPLEYANQRPLSTTWTVTGSGAFLLGSQKFARQFQSRFRGAEGDDSVTEKLRSVRVTGITTGKIVDYGVRDSMNMGAAMAPAAASCIETHLKDFGRGPSYYDKIITGDLGAIGQEILLDLLGKKEIDLERVHTDCGLEIYHNEEQGTGSGGSGCGCSAVTLASHFLPMLQEGQMERILFVPTGALLSKISFNEGETVPGIAHAVVLEAGEEW